MEFFITAPTMLAEHSVPLLPVKPEDEIVSLAERYVNGGIIPIQKFPDALHVAIATIPRIDILLSWNYRHLANVNKERAFLVANIEAGYMSTPRLTTPLEVLS